MGIPVAGCVGLNASGCQFDQLFGMEKASIRGLSRVKNVDGLIWDVKCLHKRRCGKIEVFPVSLCHMRWRWWLVGRLVPSASQLEDVDN